MSPRFSIGGYDWKLSCFPKGDPGQEAEGHLSLYLCLAPEFRDPGGMVAARCLPQANG